MPWGLLRILGPPPPEVYSQFAPGPHSPDAVTGWGKTGQVNGGWQWVAAVANGRWECGGKINVYEVGWKKAPEETDNSRILPIVLVSTSPVQR